MREIEFRGQRTDNKEWVYGLLARYNPNFEAANIVSNEILTSVRTKTVGQYTGLTDKNGTKIFEGDMVRDANTGKIFEIIYSRHMFLRYEREPMYMFYTLDGDVVEVIGNIHDNPELLKGGTE